MIHVDLDVDKLLLGWGSSQVDKPELALQMSQVITIDSDSIVNTTACSLTIKSPPLHYAFGLNRLE